MKRSAFTMVELIVAVLISGIMTTFAVMTFNAVSSAWNSSAEYMDRIQRSDYALNQVISGLRSMYYPHNGEQGAKYGYLGANSQLSLTKTPLAITIMHYF